MSQQFDKVLSVLTGIGLLAFAVLNSTNVVALSKGLVDAGLTYVRGIAGLGSAGGTGAAA